ncbi:hypothetical protein EVAR_15862_1 [Eumeta japonica]|uniref:Uncharacterized protein n=1 Tax=Eumeta variegata TaxID=151549 RepID=A0A4C1UFC9_EUMVA|nr:hypothetical protein EVAR_15862_1 [Eumeta japonica]
MDRLREIPTSVKSRRCTSKTRCRHGSFSGSAVRDPEMNGRIDIQIGNSHLIGFCSAGTGAKSPTVDGCANVCSLEARTPLFQRPLS